jgi:predicted N-acetyltransferase YhbS
MIQIRSEQPDDIDAIRQVVVEAFEKSPLGHHGEADLVDAIRATQPGCISLVAIKDGTLVGHLLSSPATVQIQDVVIEGTAIGPLSVHPNFQRQGVGSRLVDELFIQATQEQIGFVAVAGHPEYYRRFAFSPLLDFGIQHGFRGMKDSLFFIRFFTHVTRSQTSGGILKYCTEFGPQSFELDITANSCPDTDIGKH